MKTIFLFDIDMTLVHSGGAGSRAMERTFHSLYGVPDAFAGMDFAGRTDGAILRDCYRRHAVCDRDLAAELALFRDLYFTELARALAEGTCRTLPGVPELLEALADRDDVVLGLGTGNYRPAAELKLRQVKLWQYFREGGFADDSDDRAGLIAAGISRLRSEAEPAAAVWIVGDSLHDVSAGKANKALVLGVGTGHCSPDSLTLAGADAVLHDLNDTAAFLALTLGH